MSSKRQVRHVLITTPSEWEYLTALVVQRAEALNKLRKALKKCQPIEGDSTAWVNYEHATIAELQKAFAVSEKRARCEVVEEDEDDE
jgi:hypothetical protein